MARVIRSILNRLLFPLSLRWRLTHLYGASTTAIFIIILVLVHLTFRLGSTTLADRTLMQAADAASEIIDNEKSAGIKSLRARLTSFSDGFQSLFVVLENSNDVLLYASDPDLADLLHWIPHPSAFDNRLRFSTLRISKDQEIRTGTLYLPGPEGGYWLYLGIPLPPALGLFSVWQTDVVALFLLVLVLALAWIGWFVAGEALEPIQHIAEVARRVSRGNLHERIAHPGKQDEMGQLINTLNEMLERLEAATDRLNQFSANISHQLKTPLTIMRGEIEVALRGDPQVPELRAILESSLSEVEDLSKLVAHMLAYARTETEAKTAPAPARIDLLVADLARKAIVLTQQKAVTFDLKIEPVTAWVQPVRFEQALLNVLDNAIKYTPSGGRVILEAGPDGLHALVRVQDSGPGMTADELQDLFKRGRSRSSTGVGLALARALVESFMATLEITSAPGQGVTVCMRLQAVPAGAETPVSIKTHPSD